jgi:hypothetical protein
MLWALGVALALALFKAGPQMVLTATLAPAWLTAEWMVATVSTLAHGRNIPQNV